MIQMNSGTEQDTGRVKMKGDSRSIKDNAIDPTLVQPRPVYNPLGLIADG